MIKKEFVERCAFWMFKYTIVKASLEHHGSSTETLEKPIPKNEWDTRCYRHIQTKGPSKGLPLIGFYIKHGDCVIGKMATSGTRNERVNRSCYMGIGKDGVIKDIYKYQRGNITHVQVKIASLRLPLFGDKFSKRNAQKKTIGEILPESAMPFSEDGTLPDVIMNTHCFPSGTRVLSLHRLSWPIEIHHHHIALSGGGDPLPMSDFSTQTSCRMFLPQVMVTFNDGRRVRVTPDHIFLADDSKCRANNLLGKTIMATDIGILALDPDWDSDVGWTLDDPLYYLLWRNPG